MKTSAATTGVADAYLTENEFFSIGPAKKLTVIGQQSTSLPCAEKNGPSGLQCPESFLSGQWSAAAAGLSIVRQKATQAAPAPFRQTNTVTNRARNLNFNERE